MENRIIFSFYYLLFLLAWVLCVFIASRGLKWFARLHLNSSPAETAGKSSLKSKLKKYLAFQLTLIFSIIFFRNLYILFIVSIFGIALFEFIHQALKGDLKAAEKRIWVVSGIIVCIIAASSYIYLSFLLNYCMLLFLLFILSISDTFSQVVGESFRGPRLFPKISPNKTWSGMVGGLVFSILASIIFHYTFTMNNMAYFLVILISIGIFACGFVGDAVVSGLKRRIGIKDFSQIMGAQGGMLDRLDSMIFLGPAAVVMIIIQKAWQT